MHFCNEIITSWQIAFPTRFYNAHLMYFGPWLMCHQRVWSSLCLNPFQRRPVSKEVLNWPQTVASAARKVRPSQKTSHGQWCLVHPLHVCPCCGFSIMDLFHQLAHVYAIVFMSIPHWHKPIFLQAQFLFSSFLCSRLLKLCKEIQYLKMDFNIQKLLVWAGFPADLHPRAIEFP